MMGKPNILFAGSRPTLFAYSEGIQKKTERRPLGGGIPFRPRGSSGTRRGRGWRLTAPTTRREQQERLTPRGRRHTQIRLVGALASAGSRRSRAALCRTGVPSHPNGRQLSRRPTGNARHPHGAALFQEFRKPNLAGRGGRDLSGISALKAIFRLKSRSCPSHGHRARTSRPNPTHPETHPSAKTRGGRVDSRKTRNSCRRGVNLILPLALSTPLVP